jgi:hypothetical protein
MKIRTRYIPATDTAGSRIRATGGGRSCSIPYPYELSGEAVHRAAAEKLAGGSVGAGEHTATGYTFEAEDIPRAWIIRDGNGYREAVDQFPTIGEARAMVKEYRLADPAAAYSITTRAPRN